MDITEFLSRLEKVEERKGGWVALCPAHADTKPSLLVSLGATQPVVVMCQTDGCGLNRILSAIKVSMAEFKSIFVPVETVATVGKSSSKTPAGDMSVAKLKVELSLFADQLAEPAALAQQALAYVESRFGVDAERARNLGLGLLPSKAGSPRVVVPFRTPRGVARGYQARAIDPSYDGQAKWLNASSPSEAESWSPLAWMAGTNSNAARLPVIVAEGPGDGMTASTAGGLDTISVAGAGQRSDVLIADILDWTAGRKIVVAGDADRAGQSMTAGLIAALNAKISGIASALVLPDGYDLSELFAEKGTEAFGAWLTEAAAVAQTPAPPALVAAQGELLVVRPGSQNLNDLAVGGTKALDFRWDMNEAAPDEKGAARQLLAYAESRGERLACVESGEWLAYSDESGVWKRDESVRVRHMGLELADVVENFTWDVTRGANAVAAQLAKLSEGSPERVEAEEKLADARRLVKISERLNSDAGQNALVNMASRIAGTRADSFDAHPHFLNCRNGIYDYRRDALIPHDPELRLTRQVDASYDPEAKCPGWEKFLAEAHRTRPEIPGYLQEVLGASLFAMGREEVIIGHFGSGGNGKGTMLEIVASVFGDYTANPSMELFEAKPNSNPGGPNPQLMALRGAKMIFASENKPGARMDEAFMKRASGGDPISARTLHEKRMSEFVVEGIIQLFINDVPNFGDRSNGIWRRFKHVRWSETFPTTPGFKDALLEERDGILAWVIEGARRYRQRGYLEHPASVQADTAALREDLDPLTPLFADRLIRDKSSRISRADAYRVYENWFEEEGMSKPHKWSKTHFFKELRNRGFVDRPSNGTHYFYGLRSHLVAPATAPVSATDLQPTVEPTSSVEVPTQPPASTGIDLAAWAA
ncbi:phage/plasmid primase, P4 family [Leucobacter aridicollis]